MPEAIPLVGRESELSTLLDALDDAGRGRGSTVFISGEAGIGKTRLVEEVLARAGGADVLRGWCLPEAVAPLHPLREALMCGGLEHLAEDSPPPRVEAVYLIHRNGLVVARVERGRADSDADIFAGMLTAVGEFVRDAMEGFVDGEVGAHLGVMSYGRHRVVIEHGRHTYLAVLVSGRESEFLIEDMRDVLARVDTGTLADWDGRPVPGVERDLRVLIDSKKYEGIDWARDVPRVKRERLMESVRLGLVRRAAERPLILFLDDVHWADGSTLAVLHYLARNTRGSRVLIVCTYRPEEVSRDGGGVHPLKETLSHMDREGLIRRMCLAPLDPRSTSRLIREAFGDLPSHIVERIYRETQGNPLFLRETVRMLVEEGTLVREGDVWRLTGEVSGAGIPSRVHEVIARRLARLDRQQRGILEVASVLGQEFDPGVISRVLNLARLDLLRTLDEVERVHMLVVSVKDTYRFSHARVRDVLYTGIGEVLRREYHLVLGDLLAEGDLEHVREEVAYHYYRAGSAERGVPHLLALIDKSRGAYANDSALRFCTWALEMVGPDERWARERGTVLEAAGDVHATVGGYGEALDAYSRLAEEAHARNDPGLEARAYRKIASVHEKRGAYGEALEAVGRGRSALAGKESAEGGRLTALAGAVHVRRGEYDRAGELLEMAAEELERCGGEEMDLAGVEHTRGILHLDQGEYSKALECFERGLAIRERTGDPGEISASLNNIGIVFSEQGKYGKALEYYERCLAIKERIGDLWGISSSLNNIGVVFSGQEDYERALGYYERCLAIKERIGDLWGISSSLNNIGEVLSRQGEYAGALRYHERALKVREEIDDQRGMAVSLVSMGDTFSLLGELERAEGCLRRGLALAREISARPVEAVAHRGLARLHRERGEWERAEKEFETGLAMFRRMRADVDWADTMYECGLMWKRRGDMERAKEAFEGARRVFREKGLEKREDEVGKELEGV